MKVKDKELGVTVSVFDPKCLKRECLVFLSRGEAIKHGGANHPPNIFVEPGIYMGALIRSYDENT